MRAGAHATRPAQIARCANRSFIADPRKSEQQQTTDWASQEAYAPLTGGLKQIGSPAACVSY
jgi:hypothetical protein